jgi:hypothetical protein
MCEVILNGGNKDVLTRMTIGVIVKGNKISQIPKEQMLSVEEITKVLLEGSAAFKLETIL